MKLKSFIYIIGVAAGLAGCGTYEKYERPALSVSNLYGEEVPPADSTSSLAGISWRELFKDGELQSFIDTALVRNTDLRIASLKVAEAEAALQAARMAYLPSLSLSPQGNISTFDGGKAAKTYSLALSAEWEVDFTGRLTAAKRGAKGTAEMYSDARQAVRTQLIATMANSYYNLLCLDAQLDICRRTVDSWRETVRTLEARKEVGEANEAAVTQARANRLSVQQSMEKLKQQIHEQENAICLLLTSTPKRLRRHRLDEQSLPDSLCVGLPLQLLSHRPDVRQAEHALQATFYNTQVARAAFYPQVTLGGTLGWTNSDGSSITNPGKWLAQAVGSLVQPFFNKGRNQANLRMAQAQQEEALVRFQAQLLKAGSEVNDALTAWQQADKRLQLCREQKETLQRTVNSASLLMDYSDEASYLEVLTAQQSLLQAELSETQELFEKMQAVVQLFHAVGGGE